LANLPKNQGQLTRSYRPLAAQGNSPTRQSHSRETRGGETNRRYSQTVGDRANAECETFYRSSSMALERDMQFPGNLDATSQPALPTRHSLSTLLESNM
jgi:hypothetical protein